MEFGFYQLSVALELEKNPRRLKKRSLRFNHSPVLITVLVIDTVMCQFNQLQTYELSVTAFF